MELVSVTCNTSITPPDVVVTLAGQIPFNVSTGVYEYLRVQLGWPENPCAGIPE